MIIVFDTTFFALHYFSKEAEVLGKTKRILAACRQQRNRGLLPTITLAEFYALTQKAAGTEVANKCFNEIVDSGLSPVPLSVEIAKQAAILRRKYQEKIPWGDCIIAATSFINNGDFILTEDQHFAGIKEVKARRLPEANI